MGLGASLAGAQTLQVDAVSKISSERGAAALIRVQLSAVAGEDIYYEVAISEAGEAEVTLAQVPVLDAASADPQDIFIYGVDDDDRDGDASYEVTVTAKRESDDSVIDVPVTTTAFKNRDDEAQSGNEKPTEPKLRKPADGADALATNAKFSWELPVDQDGDTMRFQLCAAEADDFSDARCIEVDEEGDVNVMWAAALIPALFALGGLSSRRRRSLLALLPLMLLSGSCGSRDLAVAFDLPPRPGVTAQFPAGLLRANTQYFWRVDADDKHGNIVSSDVRRFTTEP